MRLLAIPKRVEPRGMVLDVLQEHLRHHMNIQRLRALTTPVRRALLAAHPEKAQLLAEELDRAGLLATPERPEPRGMVFSDLASLTYLDGVSPATHRCPCCDQVLLSLSATVSEPG